MSANKIRLIVVIVLFVVLAIGGRLYTESLAEDFNNISRTETYRLADHYTGFYHRPTCPKLEQTYAGAIRFESAKEAEDEGYSPCKRCDPAGPNE